jgi:hypothetical protein
MKRIYDWLWQHGPTFAIREWAWEKWLAIWMVENRRRPIDEATDETGVDDPRLA